MRVKKFKPDYYDVARLRKTGQNSADIGDTRPNRERYDRDRKKQTNIDYNYVDKLIRFSDEPVDVTVFRQIGQHGTRTA